MLQEFASAESAAAKAVSDLVASLVRGRDFLGFSLISNLSSGSFLVADRTMHVYWRFIRCSSVSFCLFYPGAHSQLVWIPLQQAQPLPSPTLSVS